MLPLYAKDAVLWGTLSPTVRSGSKASDEQRVDNCKVPPDLRGPKPRQDECSSDGPSAEAKH
jgi:hypothetical protein